MNAIKQSVAGWCVTGLLCLGLLCLTPSSVLAEPTTQGFTSPVTIQSAITIEKIHELDFGIMEVPENSVRDFKISPSTDGSGGTLEQIGGGGAWVSGQHEGEFIVSSPFPDEVGLTWEPPSIESASGVVCVQGPGPVTAPPPLMNRLRLEGPFRRGPTSVQGGVTTYIGAQLEVDFRTRGDWVCNFGLFVDFQ